MSPVSYQTIKLSKGKHSSADDGACVMELASMLAGEPFSDRPLSVSPVIASFMRSYNDHAGDERRNGLYAYAARAAIAASDSEKAHRLAFALIDELLALTTQQARERQLVQAGLRGASTDGSYEARSSLHQTSSRARRSATPTNG